MQALLRLEFDWTGGAVAESSTFLWPRQRARQTERQVFVYRYHRRSTEHSNRLRISSALESLAQAM